MRRRRHKSGFQAVVLVALVVDLASLPLATSAAACNAPSEEDCALGPGPSCCPDSELGRLAPAELCCRATAPRQETRISVPSAEAAAPCAAAPPDARLTESRTQPLPPLLRDAGSRSLLSVYCVYRN